MLSTFSRTVHSSIFEARICFAFFRQLHCVAFDWLQSHVPFPAILPKRVSPGI